MIEERTPISYCMRVAVRSTGTTIIVQVDVGSSDAALLF
jgi:hypothetical protein